MITIVLAFHSVTDGFRMLDYRRPVCTPEQSCSYEAFGILFALCDCPHENSVCPRDEKNAVEHRGTFYNFCSPRNVQICEHGEISTTVSGIQTAIHCICPEDNELVQQPNEIKGVTDYVCRQKRHCIIDEVCGLKSSVGETRKFVMVREQCQELFKWNLSDIAQQSLITRTNLCA
ncbi:hypothetical protein KIN20_008850 [Parelaphostrongylus tenuis]|uniref:Uncharacterized protein n=1 Tax=Parelaphostrongylus tenuis TaxID=148309 RepID=A0AAD5MPN0_PARTN|nr:hypothetical protein KIN20_008850 [Parelaphostrongylus tenuis]